jgi:CDP-glucose 4,6-dehydratase
LDLWPVSRLADAFCAAWGDSAKWLNVLDPAAPYESAFLSLNIEKAVQVMGWKPRWSTIEAITKTALWYRNCAKPSFNAGEACALDIQNYLSAGQE